MDMQPKAAALSLTLALLAPPSAIADDAHQKQTAGDKVKFKAVYDASQFTVTEIQPAP